MPPLTTSLRRFAPLAVLAAGFVAAYSFGLGEYLSLDALQTHKDALQNTVTQNPVLAGLAFVLAYTAAVAFSLPVASLLTLLGGFLFGLILGTVLVLTGATLGAVLVFLAARSAFGTTLRQKAERFTGKFGDKLNANPVGFLLFLRLVPLFPFFVVNIVPALFHIPLRTFVWTTFVGILPGTAIYVNVGQALGSLNNLGDIISPQTLVALSLLGALALVPTLYNHFKNKVKP